ncbi:MAG TPA: TetR/AcrR family transcriptional regulator [Gaiellaceae bacterium]|jgi:AcrR family transcriptional regulator|nr:TetR/AcrR family transcriptional regulator [Gaiellaceae bacterium]
MGLRETKKVQTRQAIAEAAMGLFVTKGFDHVTVAEIAREAGVSEKTVFNYFPTKEDIFFDEVPERLETLSEAIRGRDPGQSLVEAMHGLHAKECGRLASPGFAHFAGAIAASPALQAKEMEVMGQYTDHLAATIQEELAVHPADAQIAANLLMSVHWQFFRNAREHALAGRSGPTAVRRMRKDLERAYRLLEHGLGGLEASAG